MQPGQRRGRRDGGVAGALAPDVPQVNLARPAPAPGTLRGRRRPNNPARPVPAARPGDTQGPVPRGAQGNRARRTEGTEAGPGRGWSRGVRSAGPGGGGPGPPARPSAQDPGPAGSAPPRPTPSSVLTLLPGGTRHPRNPRPAPKATASQNLMQQRTGSPAHARPSGWDRPGR